METHTDSIVQNLLIAVGSSVVAIIVSWIAWAGNYYLLKNKSSEGPNVTVFDVLVNFSIILITYIVFAQIVLSNLIKFTFFNENISVVLPIFQLTIFVVTAIAMILYALSQNRLKIKRIWKDWNIDKPSPYFKDIGQGLLTLVIAIPTVIAISHIAEVLAILMFEPSAQEQLAISYLKMAMQSPISLIAAVISVLFLAPVIEEYLFRGILQSWLRRKIGTLGCILISSLLFASFHYSSLQASSNIPLLTSLFTFACYLGFVYEKTRCLYSPIILHVTFNLVSVMRIMFMEM